MCREEVEQAYAYWAATYDEDHASPWTSLEEGVVMSMVPEGAVDVLDAATGTGRYAVHLAQMGKRVVGVDISEEMLARARTKARDLGLAIELRQASVLAVPLPDQSVDLVICAMALAHVEDLAGAIRELIRVLRPGGHLIVTDLHPSIQKLWGPGHTAWMKDGRLFVDGRDKDIENAMQSPPIPFPQYRTDIAEYVDAIQAARAETITAFEMHAWQMRGFLPFMLIVLARKSAADTAVAPQT